MLVYGTKIQIFLTITKIALEKIHIYQLLLLILTNLYFLSMNLFNINTETYTSKSKLPQTKKSKFALAFFVTIKFKLIIPL